jgi:hypothetical protein
VDTDNKNQTTEIMMPEITDHNTINLWEESPNGAL